LINERRSLKVGDYGVTAVIGHDKNKCVCVCVCVCVWECMAELGGGKEEETREFGAQVL